MVEWGVTMPETKEDGGTYIIAAKSERLLTRYLRTVPDGREPVTPFDELLSFSESDAVKFASERDTLAVMMLVNGMYGDIYPYKLSVLRLSMVEAWLPVVPPRR